MSDYIAIPQICFIADYAIYILALKQGHISRPIAVVQKKTMSGVGKDRDEAVPFWDK